MSRHLTPKLCNLWNTKQEAIKVTAQSFPLLGDGGCINIIWFHRSVPSQLLEAKQHLFRQYICFKWCWWRWGFAFTSVQGHPLSEPNEITAVSLRCSRLRDTTLWWKLTMKLQLRCRKYDLYILNLTFSHLQFVRERFEVSHLIKCSI